MRLAVLQAAAAPGDVAANLRRLDAALEASAARGADLLVSPELFATAYAMDPHAGGPGLAERVAALSARHRVAHAWSQPLPADGGAGTGAVGAGAVGAGAIGALVADATGAVLGAYRKVHLYGAAERAAFTPGDAPPLVVEVAGLRVGVAVCYDVEFPETARAAALAGADLLAVPTAMDDAHAARVLLPARALENGLVVAYANHVAPAGPATGSGPAPGAPPFCGESVVLGADGRALARAGAAGEDLLVVDVDRAALGAARARNPYLSALRGATYATWAPPVPVAAAPGPLERSAR
jgi:predicted amidohydrolase